MMENIIEKVLLVAILIIGLIGLANVGENKLGAVDPSTFTSMTALKVGSLIQGGSATTTTASASFSLTAADICNNSIISVTPSGAAINVTLPATSTLFAACLDTKGDIKTILYNNSATAATTTTIVAGTGIDLRGEANTDDIIGQNESGTLTFYRTSDTEAIVIIDDKVVAD